MDTTSHTSRITCLLTKLKAMLQKKYDYRQLLYPISYENIGIPCTSIIPVAAENQFLSIGAEHREGIKSIVMTDLFQIGPIFIDSV